jgi:predicted transposase YbfD/YdcC
LATVKATRVKEGETSSQIRYFISSVEFGAARIMDFIRRHWEVENKLHWSLDISFREDDSRVRTGHAPENLAPIRKMALNLLRLNKSKKCGAKTKRMLCAVDTKFLSEILNS